MLLPASPFCVNDPLEVCMRADLQYWRNGWFWGLAGSGAVVLIGVIWLIQGLGIVTTGSFMDGQSVWAVIGGACVAGGLVVLSRSRRRRT